MDGAEHLFVCILLSSAELIHSEGITCDQMATLAAPFGEEITQANPGESITTRRMAQFFFACFWTIVFTGSVRKWIFPHMAVFYLLQDVPITFAYLYAIRKGFFSRGFLLLTIFFLSALLSMQACLQMIVVGLSPVVAFIGLHHYLYYLPMLLIFPMALTPKYRGDFIRLNLWFSLPMCLLSVAQAMSPTTAWVNRTSEGDAMGLPGVEIARVCGTFNFAVFYGIWIAMALSLCLGEWLLPKERRTVKTRFILPLSTFSLVLIALVSGSRQNILLCVAALVGACIAAVIIRSMRVIAVIALGAVFIPVAGALTYVVSPTEFSVVQDRFTSKEGSSDVKNRLGDTLYGWLTDPPFSLIGKGIGMGVDAAHFGSSDAYNFTYDLAEGDTIRNVMELGTPVGLFYDVLRYTLMIGMIFFAARLVRVSPHCLPLACMLFGQTAADLTRAATMTCTQVMIGYAFIFGVARYPFDEEPGLAEPEPDPSLVPAA